MSGTALAAREAGSRHPEPSPQVTRRRVMPPSVEGTHHGRLRRRVASWSVMVDGVPVGYWRAAESGNPPTFWPTPWGREHGVTESRVVRDGRGGWAAARERIASVFRGAK